MKSVAVTKLAKNATHRRENSDSVDICNGQWLVRIPKGYWPADLDARSARRSAARLPWDTDEKPADLDSVMPCKWGIELPAMPRVTLAGHDILTVQGDYQVPMLAPFMAGEKVIWLNAAFTDPLAAIGAIPGFRPEQTPQTAVPLVDNYRVVIGCIMPVRPE